MVFGNRGETSATGVAFTRDPSTGEKRFYGEFLPNAQGEDVVAGIRTPRPLNADGSGRSLQETMPQAHAELLRVRDLLEKSFRDMQDLEFTIEEGKLYLLQTRNGKRTGFAAVRIAADMVDEGLISEEEAVLRVEPEQLVQLLAPVFPIKDKKSAVDGGRLLGKGLPAGPGAACGRIALTAEKAVAMAAKGDPVVLVRVETSPEDIAGMNASAGILTTRGGMTSHAAVVARGMGKTCVVGAGEITVDYGRGKIHARKLEAGEGDFISLDGTTGEVLLGKLPTQPSEVLQVVIDGTLALEKSGLAQAFTRLLEWADARRRLGVRTNADTPTDARVAVRFGAQGIGLCRTEHMFFEEHRILAVREMILAETPELRRAALERILPMQREDFLGIFREMGERPVTIRLLDPPLHEFLPNEESALAKTAADLKVPVEKVRERVAQLHEANPMLGHRGCRLGITHPEIYETQVRAIFEAAAAAVAEGLAPNPEVMIPLIGTKAELDRLRILVDETARRVDRRDRADDLLQGGNDDRDPARRAPGEGDRPERGLLLLRHQRPDADDLRLFARRRRFVPPRVHREGHPAGGSVREPRSGRRGRARRAGHRAGPADEPEVEGRHLRRARRRPAFDRVLPPGRPRLRLLLAVPRAGRAPGGREGGAVGQRGRLLHGMIAAAAALAFAMTSAAPRPADLVLLSAKIWTGDADLPEAQALAARGGRIVAVGSDAEIARWRGPATRVIEAGGKRVVPGFIDSHTHMTMGGLNLLAVDLRKTRDEADFTRRLAEFAKGRPAGRWITDGAWDHQQWPVPRLPTRALLDPATGDRPTCLARQDGHMVVCNSLALKLAKITRDTPDPPGGVIVRDAAGEPTGVLKDAAMDAIWAVRPPRTLEELVAALSAAMKHAAERGVTSVQDLPGNPRDLDAWEQLRRSRER